MNATIRGHNLKVTALMALLAVAFAVQQVATTGDGEPAIRATSAGGSSLAEDPHIDRHAEVVAHYLGDSIR